MKQFKFLLMTLITITMCTFASCGKDDDDDVIGLNGTTWTYTRSTEGTVVTQKVRFSTSVDCILTVDYDYSDGTAESTTIRYTYSYEPPYVNLYPDDSERALLRGFINGNTMELTNKSSNKNIGTFNKN